MRLFPRQFISSGSSSVGRVAEAVRARVVQSLSPDGVGACALDLAGTTMDLHSLGPLAALCAAFNASGVKVTMEEARLEMGVSKDLHVARIMEIPSVKERWIQVHGRAPTNEDVKKVYAEFVPMQLRVLPQYSTLIPGVAEVTKRLQANGIKLGLTTGYTHEMVEVILDDIRKQGYRPDAIVAADDVKHGSRPNPHMIFRVMDLLGIKNPCAVVVVDDTPVGMEAAVNAEGCWGVGVSHCGNGVGISSPEEYKELLEKFPQELEERYRRATKELQQSGAHYVIEDLRFLPQVIEDINKRLAEKKKPSSSIRPKVIKPEHSTVVSFTT